MPGCDNRDERLHLYQNVSDAVPNVAAVSTSIYEFLNMPSNSSKELRYLARGVFTDMTHVAEG